MYPDKIEEETYIVTATALAKVVYEVTKKKQRRKPGFKNMKTK